MLIFFLLLFAVFLFVLPIIIKIRIIAAKLQTNSVASGRGSECFNDSVIL